MKKVLKSVLSFICVVALTVGFIVAYNYALDKEQNCITEEQWIDTINSFE